jgi:MFS family permease
VTSLSAGRDRLDGGRAWLDAAMACLSMFVVFVTPYSFGTFVKPMAAEFHANRGGIALVFGITSFLYFALGAVTGPLVHRVGPRRMILFGGFVQVCGILLTSRVHSLGQAYLTYGIGVGIGVACGYVPMVAVVGGWFERKRAAAVGIAVSGIGLSSLLGAPLAARLIRIYDWRHAFVVLAVGTGVLLCVVAALIRTPPSFGTAPAYTLSSAVRTRSFALSYASVLLIAIPLFSVFVNIVPYAEDHGMTKASAATLVSLVGAFSIAGRIGLAALAQRVGIPRVYLGSFVLMALTQILWLSAASSYAKLALFASVFGAAYGGFISLSPGFLAGVFGADQLGGLAGINYSAAGFGALLGPTAGAWLVDRTNGYAATIVCGLIAGGLGSLFLATLVRRTSPQAAR